MEPGTLSGALGDLKSAIPIQSNIIIISPSADGKSGKGLF